MFNSIAYAANVAQTTQDQTTGGLSNLFFKLIEAFPLWIAAGVIFTVSYYLANIVKKITSYRASKKNMAPEVVILIERAVHTGIIILGLVISFEIVGINIASLFAFLGVGVGFALKDLLANLFAGVMILTQHKFKIGDTIKVNDILGKITEIDSRVTQILGLDGTNLIVPNATMLTAVVQNFTANTFRRVAFEVGVHYSTPLKECIDLTIKSIRSNNQIVPKPEVQVIATQFGDSAIILECRFWVESTDNWVAIRSHIIQTLKQDYDRAGIEIPFPITTLTLDDNDKNIMQAFHLPAKKTTMIEAQANNSQIQKQQTEQQNNQTNNQTNNQPISQNSNN